MKIFHIALESDWQAARRTGQYTTSTLGRSLAEEGFIHAARPEQVQRVSDTYYAGVRKPLVRLEIETDKLTADWREDPVGADTYPHVYGPLNVDAVTDFVPWHREGRPKTFLEVFLVETLLRIFLAIAAMLLAFLGAALAGSALGTDQRWIGALAGLALGVAGFALVVRRRST